MILQIIKAKNITAGCQIYSKEIQTLSAPFHLRLLDSNDCTLNTVYC